MTHTTDSSDPFSARAAGTGRGLRAVHRPFRRLVAEGQPSHLGHADAAEAILEPRVGGRWYERAEDGSECDWGYVREVDRPERILLAWHLTPEWKFDPDPAKATEVEVLFTAEEDQTRVTLQHRGFEVHGEAGPGMRDSVAADGGWSSLLEQIPRGSLIREACRTAFPEIGIPRGLGSGRRRYEDRRRGGRRCDRHARGGAPHGSRQHRRAARRDGACGARCDRGRRPAGRDRRRRAVADRVRDGHRREQREHPAHGSAAARGAGPPLRGAGIRRQRRELRRAGRGAHRRRTPPRDAHARAPASAAAS